MFIPDIEMGNDRHSMAARLAISLMRQQWEEAKEGALSLHDCLYDIDQVAGRLTNYAQELATAMRRFSVEITIKDGDTNVYSCGVSQHPTKEHALQAIATLIHPAHLLTEKDT